MSKLHRLRRLRREALLTSSCLASGGKVGLCSSLRWKSGLGWDFTSTSPSTIQALPVGSSLFQERHWVLPCFFLHQTGVSGPLSDLAIVCFQAGRGPSPGSSPPLPSKCFGQEMQGPRAKQEKAGDSESNDDCILARLMGLHRQRCSPRKGLGQSGASCSQVPREVVLGRLLWRSAACVGHHLALFSTPRPGG